MSTTGAAQRAGEVLAQWDDWSARCTDQLFGLDTRATSVGTDADRLDVAAAFLCRKAIFDRIEQLRVAVQRGGSDVAALSTRPLVDGQGGLVADNLSSAANLVDAIIAKVDQRLTAIEQADATVERSVVAIVHDLAEADRLVEQLGIHAGRVAKLHTRAATTDRTAVSLTALATDVMSMVTVLRSADSDRLRIVAALPGIPAKLEQLVAREVAVRAVVARCRDKVLPLPNLAVPAVAAIEPLDAAVVLSSMPWPAAFAKLQPYLDRLDRLGAALDEVDRRFSLVLSRRDDLRGLLQAYRDKAGAHGLAEDPLLEPAYRVAEAVLWSAPCNVDVAEPLVDVYTDAVNNAVVLRSTPRDSGER